MAAASGGASAGRSCCGGACRPVFHPFRVPQWRKLAAPAVESGEGDQKDDMFFRDHVWRELLVDLAFFGFEPGSWAFYAFMGLAAIAAPLYGLVQMMVAPNPAVPDTCFAYPTPFFEPGEKYGQWNVSEAASTADCLQCVGSPAFDASVVRFRNNGAAVQVLVQLVMVFVYSWQVTWFSSLAQQLQLSLACVGVVVDPNSYYTCRGFLRSLVYLALVLVVGVYLGLLEMFVSQGRSQVFWRDETVGQPAEPVTLALAYCKDHCVVGLAGCESRAAVAFPASQAPQDYRILLFFDANPTNPLRDEQSTYTVVVTIATYFAFLLPTLLTVVSGVLNPYRSISALGFLRIRESLQGRWFVTKDPWAADAAVKAAAIAWQWSGRAPGGYREREGGVCTACCVRRCAAGDPAIATRDAVGEGALLAPGGTRALLAKDDEEDGADSMRVARIIGRRACLQSCGCIEPLDEDGAPLGPIPSSDEPSVLTVSLASLDRPRIREFVLGVARLMQQNGLLEELSIEHDDSTGAFASAVHRRPKRDS
jgi:hypothetical protein